MALCDLCSRLTIANLYPPSIYYHGENLAAVQESGQTCQLCKLIHWCCTLNDSESESCLQTQFEGAVNEVTPYEEKEERGHSSIKLQLMPGTWYNEGKPNELKHIGIWMKSKYMVSSMTLLVEEGDALGTKALTIDGQDHFIANRILTSERPSEAHFHVARRWLRECQSNHVTCREQGSDLPELPPRVIDVGKEGTSPRLIDGSGRRAQYATLSHCWGQSPTVKTEMATLRLHQDHITLEALPKTFRDAMEMCRKLDIEYIWIDSLCIIQDNLSDWEIHSSIMGSIYYDSTITLAASDAPDSSKGLFVPVVPNTEYPWLGITALQPAFGNNQGQVYISGPGDIYGSPEHRIYTCILQSRGWVVQEKCLAVRTLHFLKGEMVWECSAETYDQVGSVEPLPYTAMRTHLQDLQKAFNGPYVLVEDDDDELEDDNEEKEFDNDEEGAQTTTASRGKIVDLRNQSNRDEVAPTLLTSESDLYCYLSDIETSSTLYGVWYMILAIYCVRQLTFASDKLPALAGIAGRIHDITKDAYLAGHWRRDLDLSLFWKVETESSTGHPGRCKEYRAPSWSWASVNASTLFDFAALALDRDFPTTIQVMEAHVQVDGKNPFGRVTGGSLVMQANVLRASWHKDSASWRLEGSACPHGDIQYEDLKLTTSDDTVIGVWKYDDVINGIMPGAPLEEHTPLEEVYTRCVPHGYFGSVAASNIRIHGPDVKDGSTLWRRGTYVPENLVLVQGPVRKLDEYEQEEHGGRLTATEVLVLASTGDSDGEYRRVGIGKLGIWDSTIATVEVLTVV